MPGKEEIMPINPISAEQLYFKPFKTLPSLVDGIIPKGMTVLAGSSKIGKSWMALDLAIAIASGGEFLGRPVRQAGVLYFCLEDTEHRVRDRMYKLCDESPPGLYFCTASERLGNGFTPDVVDMLRRHPDIELIIIDTLQKVRQSDDGSGSGTYSKDYEEIAKIKRIADVNDRSILVIHHLRKQPDKNDPFNEISGSVAICGASDTNIVLKKSSCSSTAEMYIRGRDVEEH
jgi:RecA-family ATPase